MRRCLRQLFAACLLWPALAAHADPQGYASGFDTLYRIDLATAHATKVGAFGSIGTGSGATPITDVEGLAFAPDGTLYGVSDALKILLRIDTASGRATVVGPLNLAVPSGGQFGNFDFGLAATCDGRLWLSSDVTRALWEVNTGNATTRLVGTTGAQISGLAAKGMDLYGVGVNGDESLYRIDTTTGLASAVGRIAPSLSFYDAGLDFDGSGKLWLTLDYLPPPSGQPAIFRNDLAFVDVVTGAATIVGPITGAGSGLDTVQMEGLAVAAPAACGAGGGGPVAVSVPLLTPKGTLLLFLGFLAAAMLALRTPAARERN
jgi:hypothetical protein